ncbi:MAG: DUF4388 domain-containing protein [Pyrinomonadaceae bacterium]
MALTGELTDLSLAELIEFFCNQRKSGRLTVSYPQGSAYFYLQAGAVVHASVGTLRGIEAVYYALTLQNASFNFDATREAPEHTINQPWTSVVLEGLRRMDEGIRARSPFAQEAASTIRPTVADQETVKLLRQVQSNEDALGKPSSPEIQTAIMPESFLSHTEAASRFGSGPWKLGAIFAALILIVGVIAVPWYARGKGAKLPGDTKLLASDAAAPTASQPTTATATPAAPSAEDAGTPSTNLDAAESARREHEARLREEARLRAKASEATTSAPASQSGVTPNATQSSSGSGSKKVVVQVTYDENGRVTQATGNDPTALRIARQKRFPPGKAGSATVTIPIN